MIVDAVDRDAICRTVYGEARGEGIPGWAAVAHVILNRARTPAWWGFEVWDVCHHPAQFSCWNPSDPNFLKLVSVPYRGADLSFISITVGKVCDGLIVDPTGGATHYKVTGTPASWDKATVGITPVIIGHHSFYKLGPKA